MWLLLFSLIPKNVTTNCFVATFVRWWGMAESASDSKDGRDEAE